MERRGYMSIKIYSGRRCTVDRRPGMTLVEVLAVCVIIGILAAMAIPALTRAIARSRLTQCTHNEYQLAFALLRYNEQTTTIPGWLNQSPNGATVPCSWTVPILPFLGRSDIYDMWPTLPNDPTMGAFICPMNRPAKAITYPALHYAANVGTSGTSASDGVFLNLFTAPASTLSLDAIAEADGTSTTLAFAEKAASAFQPHTWTFSRNDAELFGSGTTAPPVFGVDGSPRFPVINNADVRAFAPSSVHGGGVVVAFCDGHTAFLSDTLQPYEYAQLITPRSRWQGTTNKTNSLFMQPWLLKGGKPYLLDEKVLRP